jgi:hypothetical protein
MLGFLGIVFYALTPLFYSTPIEYGGLGLSPNIIGLCLGFLGVTNGLWQAFFFAKVVRIWGPKRMFMVGTMGYIPVFMILPITQLLARQWGLCPFVWALVACQLLFMVMAEMGYGETLLVTHVYVN